VLAGSRARSRASHFCLDVVTVGMASSLSVI